MKLKVWIKANMADNTLFQLRKGLIDLIEPDSSVLDIGCGTGDLLFKAAQKIEYGLGVDLDGDMITFAKEKCKKDLISNLEFDCSDAESLNSRRFDFATSTLCLHEMTEEKACSILRLMAKVSDRVIVADYTTPTLFLSKLGIEFDEIISGHYQKFRHYRKTGGIPAYARMAGLTVKRAIPSDIDGITIWEMHIE